MCIRDSPDDATVATGHGLPTPAIRIFKNLPLAVIVKLDDVKTEFLPPKPCAMHSVCGAERTCTHCDFRAGCVAVEPQLSYRSFIVDVLDPVGDFTHRVRVQRRQVPITIKTGSTLHTFQGVTASPGLIFHWKFPRFFSEESRWLATYVALSRPPSLAQLISVGIPADLRDIIEGGPPEGILSRFAAMFEEREEATHLPAAGVMSELGWHVAEQ